MMPASIAIGRMLGVLAGMAVLLACLAFLAVWLRRAADLFLACLLAPRRALTITFGIAGALLAVISVWLHPLIGMTVAGWLAPPLSLFALDLVAWPREAEAAPKPAAFFKGAWLGAFHRTEQARKRAAYQAPQTVNEAEF